MKKVLLAVATVLALSSSSFAFTVPAKGTKAYTEYLSTRRYVEASINNPDNPPAMPKNFNWLYVNDDEQDAVTNAVITYAALHPTAVA